MEFLKKYLPWILLAVAIVCIASLIKKQKKSEKAAASLVANLQNPTNDNTGIVPEFTANEMV